ncbi:MAG: winged helix-turn-helix domain-containing protein [Nocardioidaceae bacterium]
MSLKSTRPNAEPTRTPPRRLLEDPLAIRALAHPIRLALQSIVSRSGRVTAAEAARQLGISQALATHHLRQLAKYGFVEQVAGDDRRARPWQSVSPSFDFDATAASSETAAAGAILEQVSVERALSEFLDWQQRRAEWSEDWQRASGVSLHTGYLTSTELAELGREVNELVSTYMNRRPVSEGGSRVAHAAPVDITVVVVPAGQAPEPA